MSIDDVITLEKHTLDSSKLCAQYFVIKLIFFDVLSISISNRIQYTHIFKYFHVCGFGFIKSIESISNSKWHFLMNKYIYMSLSNFVIYKIF